MTMQCSLSMKKTGQSSWPKFMPIANTSRSVWSWRLAMPVSLFFSTNSFHPKNHHPPPSDCVKVDFKKAMTPKDRISPKAGRTHAPGKSYAPFERFLPKLSPRPKQALDKQIQGLRKSKDAENVTPSPSTPTTATPTSATSSSQPTRSRSELEVELDKYLPINVENGTFFEDEFGVPLIVLARHTIPQPEQQQMNVRF
jgi:hypothetical protein